MPTRNVNLTEHFDRFIEAGITSGRFSNASEVVREGLRLIERREAEDAAKLDALRAAAQVGLDALDRGDGRGFADGAELARYLEDLADKALNDPSGG